MAQSVLGIVGGSGFYHLPGLANAEWRQIDSPWGPPSDEVLFAEVEGLPHVDAGLACVIDQLLEQEVRSVVTLGADHGGQRVEPFARLLGVGIVGGGAGKGIGHR